MPSWTCEICGQIVELREDNRFRRPVEAYEHCGLQHHYVDNACIAYAASGRRKGIDQNDQGCCGVMSSWLRRPMARPCCPLVEPSGAASP
jgi:hypothetical protein